MPLFTRNRTNPIFYGDQLSVLLRDEPERLERMRHEPDSLDLLTWNVFMSLDTHRDQRWLAYRLQALGGAGLREPVRLSVFSGERRAPQLCPSPEYVRSVRRRTGATDGDHERVALFEQPIEIPVRVETPDVLLLVDTGRRRLRAGVGGRDRLAEVVDAGLEHARRLSSTLAVCLVADPGSEVLTRDVPRLAGPGAVAELVPWRSSAPPVEVHGITWSQLLTMWHEERAYLDVGGEPVRDFVAYARRVTG